MHKLRSSTLAMLGTVGLVLGVAVGAGAAPAYRTCAAVNVDYPTGVASTQAAAALATGFQRPTVNRKLYNRLVAARPALDRPKNGIACEVRQPVTPPSAVQGLSGSATSHTEARLQWSAPGNMGNGNITGYTVAGGGAASVVGTSAFLTGLTASTTYTFSVVAVNQAGAGTPATVTVTTQAPPVAPTPAPAAVRYANCDAARAAGVTPIRRPSPLYDANRHLDRDGDGDACE